MANREFPDESCELWLIRESLLPETGRVMAPNWKGPIRMKENPVALLTSGRIAAELGVRLPRVVYVLATRPHIKPRARAGTLRLYDRHAIAMIRDELNAIESHRRAQEVASHA